MIYSISGKKGSGKDTVGKIMQILLNSPHLSNEGVLAFFRKEVNPDNFYYKDNWVIKKFADKLKDIVCLLIGCTREQLEDEDFKSKELSEEWDRYEVYNPTEKHKLTNKLFATEELANEYINGFEKFSWSVQMQVKKIPLTPRLLLQLLGTECGREIIHPQIWVNALMADYVEDMGYKYTVGYDPIHENDTESKAESEAITVVHDYPGVNSKTIQVYLSSPPQRFNNGFPNWIITDMRFPNEQQAVDIKHGICIRVNRKRILTIDDFIPGMKYYIKERFSNGTVKTQQDYDNAEWLERFYHESDKPYIERMLNGRNAQNGLLGLRLSEHESETALDNAPFDYTIDNDGTMDELIDEIRIILERENLLCNQVKDN